MTRAVLYGCIPTDILQATKQWKEFCPLGQDGSWHLWLEHTLDNAKYRPVRPLSEEGLIHILFTLRDRTAHRSLRRQLVRFAVFAEDNNGEFFVLQRADSVLPFQNLLAEFGKTDPELDKKLRQLLADKEAELALLRPER